LLGLHVPYTAQEAEQAFREAAKAAHPDHGGDPRRFVELQAAYEQALALLQERRTRRPPPARSPQIPLPRRRSTLPAPGSRTLSFFFLGIRVAAVVALLTGLIAGGLSLWHRRQNTAQRVDGRAADTIARLGGSVEWDGNDIALVSLRGLEITSERLEALRRFGMLERLDLSGSTFDDASLVQVLPLLSLREIDMSGTGVTDLGVSLLKSLAGLETLRLDDTRVTDAGLQYLDQLPKLKAVSLRGAAVTLEGIARSRYPDRYHRDTAAAAGSGRATTLADFLPERQWAVQELRSAAAAFGLLTSEDLREASRIDLAITYERDALSNPVLDTALDLGPLPEPTSRRARRVATLADLMASEGDLSNGLGRGPAGGATPALAGSRSTSKGGPGNGKPVADSASDEEDDAPEDNSPTALSSIFGRKSASRSSQAPVAWILPQDEPDGRLRPGFLMMERPRPEEDLAERDDKPGLLPLERSRDRAHGLGTSTTPRLDLPSTKRRNFYLGEIGVAPEPRQFEQLPGSSLNRPNPFALPGFGRSGLNPFGPADALSPTSHLDALRGSRKMPAPGSR
jgi:hypothetical protein